MWRNKSERKGSKRAKIETVMEDQKFPIIDELMASQGLNHITEQIFGYLSKKTLSSCLLVSKKWKTYLTDESRVYLWSKLKHLLVKKTFKPTLSPNYIMRIRNKTLLKLYPDWINVLNHFKRKGSLEDLKEVINFLDLYFDKYNFYSHECGYSPLFPAVSFRFHKFLEILFKSKIQINFNPKSPLEYPRIETSTTPIEQALTPIWAHKDYTEIVQLFLDYTDLVSTVPIHFICSDTPVGMVKMIMNHESTKNIDFSALDSDGLSVLHWACFSQHYAEIGVLELLLDHRKEIGLDVNQQGDYDVAIKRWKDIDSMGDEWIFIQELRRNGKLQLGSGTPLHG